MKPTFAIIGCGRVGVVLGKYLVQAGHELVGLASKNFDSAKTASKVLGTKCFSDIPWKVTKKADIVFLTTPDGVIADVCANIAQNNGFCKNAIVLHCSGALPSTILSPAKKNGAFIGSMHPLQSFASNTSENNPFCDIVISIEGEKEATIAAEKIALDLGAQCFTIQTDAKTMYHAAAVVASNYLVTLLDLAFKLIETAGISNQDAFKALKPLIFGTLANIEKIGIPKSLTGPIARGDIETIEKHLKEIKLQKPELLMLYKMLGFHTVDVAENAGFLSEELIKKLKQIMR